MSKASIISVGNELLSGQCVDTNRAWLGQTLFESGIEVVSGYTVSDEISIIKDAIEQAVSQADIIIITGGLGPTDDDLTRQALAEYLGCQLVYRPDLYEIIASYFLNRHIEMPQKNRIQAFLPADSDPIPNDVGTAPGVLVRKDGKIIAALPGVPEEMRHMFESFLLRIIQSQANNEPVVVKRLKLLGIGESALAEKLGDLMQRGRNPLVNCTVKQGVITLHVVAKSQSFSQADDLSQKCVDELVAIAGAHIYSQDNEEIEAALARLLNDNRKTIAIAESCTGGLICKMLTDIPGASGFLKSGWITYSNEAKMRDLGVPKVLLDQFGAVSEQVAASMAQGALKISGADLALAVTGIAGPGGGTEQKPVGLVYIALAQHEKTVVKQCMFPQSREICRLRSAQTAIEMVIREFLR